MKKKLYISYTEEIELIPGYGAEKCPGNGEHKDALGNPIECRCDECDYLAICLPPED